MKGEARDLDPTSTRSTKATAGRVHDGMVGLLGSSSIGN